MNRAPVRRAVEQCTIFLIGSRLSPLERLAAAVLLIRYLTRAALFAGHYPLELEQTAATAHEWHDEEEAALELRAKRKVTN